MLAPKIPPPLREAAHTLFTFSLQLREGQSVHKDETRLGGTGVEIVGADGDFLEDADEEVVRAYLRFAVDESVAALDTLFTAGEALARHACRLWSSEPVGDAEADPASAEVTLCPQLTAGLRRWSNAWRTFERLWKAWHTASPYAPPAPAAPAHTPMAGAQPAAVVLTADQRAAVKTLVAMIQARRGSTAAMLPTSLLPRWSVPLLVGPAGGGKAFACAQASRSLGLEGYARWDIGSWSIVASRSGRSTLDQIEKYITAHPDALIYLAGVDALSTARTSGGDSNITYMAAIAAEVEGFLDGATARSAAPSAGHNDQPRTCVALGGRFASLWGEAEIGGAHGTDAWKLADAEPLAGAEAVGEWLREHSGLPAGILRRVAAEPLVIRHMDRVEAERIAGELCAQLPPAMDGALRAPELAAALTGPHGWRSLAHRIERSLMTQS